MATGFHCRRATSREKKLGQKLRFANDPSRPRLALPQLGRPGSRPWCSRSRSQPSRHGSKRRGDPCAHGRPAFEQFRQRAGLARRSPTSRSARARARSGRYSSTPPGRSAASSATLRRASGSPRGGPLRVQAVDPLDEHEAPGAGLAGDPRGDRVGGHLPGRGQRVERQRGGQQHGGSSGAAPARGRRSARRRGISSLSSQPNCSMPRIAMRCEVSARSPKRRSASRTASAKPAPPGTTSSGWRSPSSPSAVHKRLQRVVAAEPAADLDDGQHRRAASSAASAAAGATSAAGRAPRRRSVGDRSPQTRGDFARQGRRRRRPRRRVPRAAADAAPGAAASSIWRSCSPCEEGGDRVDLACVELVGVGAHQPGDALARERDRGRAAVRRGAVVRLLRQMAEDEMDVGADREVLRRHRAPPATDRHARRDRREVGAQHAGVDELAGQQPLEVVVPASPRRARRRSGRCRRSCCRRRSAARRGTRPPPRAPKPPSWRRRRPTAARAPPPSTRARRSWSARSAAGRRAPPRPRRARTPRLRAWSGTRRKARRSS